MADKRKHLVDQFNGVFGTNKKVPGRSEMVDEVTDFFGGFGVDLAFVDDNNVVKEVVRTKKPRKARRR